MRIALVHDFLFKLGGAERVLKAMADLFPDAPIYTLLYDEEKCGTLFPASRVIASGLNNLPRFIRKHPQWLLSSYPETIERFDFSGFDLVISSSGAFSHGAITSPTTKHLCYCHSPMRYAWDYTHEYLAELSLPWWQEYLVRKKLLKLRTWDRTSADRPDQYLANSEHVKKRLKKYFRVEAEVLYPPVDIDRFFPMKRHQDYFLMISALSPFKKIDIAIEAFNKIRKKLVIVGEGKDSRRLKAMAGPTIEFLGRKTDEEVKDALEHCRAFIFPGEEDFGIAPVEAMAAGKPVIAYAKGGVLETVVDGKTGFLFHEPNAMGLEEALGKFFEHESELDAHAIAEEMKRFHPDRFKEKLLSLAEAL